MSKSGTHWSLFYKTPSFWGGTSTILGQLSFYFSVFKAVSPALKTDAVQLRRVTALGGVCTQVRRHLTLRVNGIISSIVGLWVAEEKSKVESSVRAATAFVYRTCDTIYL